MTLVQRAVVGSSYLPCRKAPGRQGRRPTQHICRASNDEQGGRDWDQAWRDFTRSVGATMPEVEGRVTTQAPRFSQRRAEWNSGQRKEEIREQERFLLNLWSQDIFFKSGGVAVVAFFLLLFVLAGPPPSDGRCTLPWC